MATRIIAVVNQKGGVGKTTTTANLGTALAFNHKKKVLLIDLDPQSNLSLHFGLNMEDEGKSCYDLLLNSESETFNIDDIILKTDIETLEIIPASIKLSNADIEMVNVVGRERLLYDALESKIKSKAYDYILIDCSPSLGLLTLNALTTAIEVFIPLQADYFALQGIGKLLNTIGLVKKRINPKLSITGIIVCMFNSRRKLSWDVLTKIKDHFKKKVFKTKIRIDVHLAESPSFGKPIFTYRPSTNGAKDYSALAKEVNKAG